MGGGGEAGYRLRAHGGQIELDQPVASLDHLPDEAGVLAGGVELPAAPQDEGGLVDGVLEAVVALLGDAVLVAITPVDADGLQPRSGPAGRRRPWVRSQLWLCPLAPGAAIRPERHPMRRRTGRVLEVRRSVSFSVLIR